MARHISPLGIISTSLTQSSWSFRPELREFVLIALTTSDSLQITLIAEVQKDVS
jgi:hypothetical protein